MVSKYCPRCGRIVDAKHDCRDRSRKHEPWRSEYKSGEYQRNRQVVIARQRGRCKDCGRICAEFDGSAWKTQRLGGEVDHERPLRAGGSNDTSNLALRCKVCHSKADIKRRNSKPGKMA